MGLYGDALLFIEDRYGAKGDDLAPLAKVEIDGTEEGFGFFAA